jgi:diguanylate cyclase (GGDEF)-like protein/PAS domain S-box-containing protein
MAQRKNSKTDVWDRLPGDAAGAALLGAQALRLTAEHVEEREGWRLERARLTEEKSWLRALIDQVPDYLFVKDRENRFVIANKAVAADLGRTPESIIGLTDEDLHRADRAAEFMADDSRVIRTGQPMIDKEEFVVLPSGEQRWLSTSKLPLRDEIGQIVGLVGVARDVTLRKQAEEQVRFLAYSDTLTRLPNRASFEANFPLVAEALGPGEQARLILVDLDRFKHVNDSLGHRAGDELLCSVAERLSRLVAGRGQVARIGGDEFTIVISFPTVREEHEFCDRVVRELRTFTISGSHMHVGASVGIATIHRAGTALATLREADIALYEAKASGRNGWKAFESQMADLVETRLRLESDLHTALITGEQFRLLYQPIFDITGKQCVGVEALLRWQHPKLGLLGPERFIPLAEDLGYIVELGEIVLRRTCRLLSKGKVPWAAVNVSPVELRDPGFLERVMRVLSAEGVGPSRIEFEITEGVVLEQTGAAGGLLEQLRSAGFRIAIDDFGTGYSSLNYLKRIAVDKIKIDRSFVSAIGTPKADAIVRAVIAFAKALRVTITAEGVETDVQRTFLQDAGCDQLQGYLLARPMGGDSLTEIEYVEL